MYENKQRIFQQVVVQLNSTASIWLWGAEPARLAKLLLRQPLQLWQDYCVIFITDAGHENGEDDSLQFLASLEKRDTADDEAEPAHNHRAVAAVNTEDAEGIFDMLETFIKVSQHDLPGHNVLPAVTVTATSQPQQPSTAVSSSSGSSGGSSSDAHRPHLQGWFGSSDADEDPSADEDTSEGTSEGKPPMPKVQNSYQPPRRHPKPDRNKYDSADDHSNKDTIADSDLDSDVDQEPDYPDKSQKYQKGHKTDQEKDQGDEDDGSDAEGNDEEGPTDKGPKQYQQHPDKPMKGRQETHPGSYVIARCIAPSSRPGTASLAVTQVNRSCTRGLLCTRSFV
jgi:hypothetical protein